MSDIKNILLCQINNVSSHNRAVSLLVFRHIIIVIAKIASTQQLNKLFIVRDDEQLEKRFFLKKNQRQSVGFVPEIRFELFDDAKLLLDPERAIQCCLCRGLSLVHPTPKFRNAAQTIPPAPAE